MCDWIFIKSWIYRLSNIFHSRVEQKDYKNRLNKVEKVARSKCNQSWGECKETSRVTNKRALVFLTVFSQIKNKYTVKKKRLRRPQPPFKTNGIQNTEYLCDNVMKFIRHWNRWRESRFKIVISTQINPVSNLTFFNILFISYFFQRDLFGVCEFYVNFLTMFDL